MSLNKPLIYIDLNYDSQKDIILQNSNNIQKALPVVRGTLSITVDKNNLSGILNITGTVSEERAGGETYTIQKVNVSTLDRNYVLKIDISEYYNAAFFNIKLDAQVAINGISETSMVTVAELTESTAHTRFNAVLSIPKNSPVALLKAFCNFPGEILYGKVFCSWESSTDGIHWNDYLLNKTGIIGVEAAVQTPLVDVSGVSLDDADSASHYEKRTFYALLPPNSPTDTYIVRPDCVFIPSATGGTVDNTLYRFRMSKLRDVKSDDIDSIKKLGVSVVEDLRFGMSIFTPVISSDLDPLYSTINNVSKSISLYYNHRLYGFGNSNFKNNIVVTYPGETVRPLSEIIELNTADTSVATALVPWKDYVVAFTDTSTHVITRDSAGFKATAVNAFIGVPIEDRRCVKNILNGIIFKSGSKVYVLYPNTYSGSETVLNLTDVSQPIEDYLIEYASDSENLPFALSTETAYMLFMPKADCTVCLKYEYNTKRWTLFEYPVVLLDYEMLSVTDIRVTGYIVDSSGTRSYGEYFIEQSLEDCFNNVPENVFSGDWVSESSLGNISNDIQDYETSLANNILRPISFAIDSGQKTDNPVTEKMFTESKFIVSTLHEKDTFPMRVIIHVNGDPKVHTTNVYTDSAFWQNSTGVGTLSTNFAHDDSELFNVIRQMFIRYSGKGKSIRHIIEGESVYPFKIYEILYRYRSLNTKQ